MKPTLKQIAEMAGVSVPTVSMAIHGKGRLTPETRQKILDCAIEIGYPIHLRRKQVERTAQAATVAILQNIDPEWAFIWVFIRPIVQEIELAMRNAGYTVVIIPITNYMSDDVILQKINESGAIGVFAIHLGDAPLFTIIEKGNTPVVLVMNNDLQDRFHSICSDDFQGAYEGTRHLIELGHKRFAYLDTERPNLPRLLHDRHFGFRKALAEYDISFSRQLNVRYHSHDEERLLLDLKEILSSDDPPTALFCLDDELAAHAIVQLGKLGKRIPQDISVMAPGDVLDYEVPYNPQITTMRINTTQMGRAAASMMLGRLTDTDSEVMVVKVRQQMVDRGSCIPFPGSLEVL